MKGQKTQGKGVELEDRVMERMRVRMNKVVSVCRGLSCQSSYPSKAASHSQQHDRDVKQSA